MGFRVCWRSLPHTAWAGPARAWTHWDLRADAVPIAPALHHLCQLGKCWSLDSSSGFCLLTQMSPNRSKLHFKGSTHESVKCNCDRYKSVSHCFAERTLPFRGVQLGNPLQQLGPSWKGARAEAGRASPLQLRAEWGLELPNPLLPKMWNGSFTSSIVPSLGRKWGTPLKSKRWKTALT